MKRKIHGVIVAGSIAIQGCYAYRPASTPTPGPRTEVRVILTTASVITTHPPGSDTTRTEHQGVLEASGTVQASAADTLALLLGELDTADGSVAGLSNQIALLPTARIARIEERRFQAGTTVLVGLGALAIAGAVYLLLLISAISHGF